MTDALAMILAALAGVLLGAGFFGGLWWTIRRALSSPQPALWFFGSLLVRTVVALAGFYLVAHGHWERLVPCLGGFVLSRMIVTRLTRGGVPDAT